MKKWLERFKKDERGLTLVELLAVIVILAIVGAIAFVAIGNVMDNSRKDAHIANAQQIIAAAKLYDASVENLESKTDNKVSTAELRAEQLIGDISDPWGKASSYEGEVTKVITKDTNDKITGVEYQVTITRTGADTEYKISNANEAKLNLGREGFESDW